MTIKDAEKLTGLTTKSIRFYEEKGLIKVERNSDNDYRNYNEDVIDRLKFIKTLRYLDFSIEEISIIFEDDSLSSFLEKKSKQLEEESNNNLEKQSICNLLLKDKKKKDYKKIIDEYSDTINFLESTDGKEFKVNIIDLLCPNLSSIIVQSFMYVAPIIWLFINICNKRWDTIMLNSIAALICTIFLTIEWGYYFNYLKKHKEEVKEKNKKNSLTIPIMFILVILVVIMFVILCVGIAYFLAPKDYLFFETSPISTKLMIVSIVFLFIIILGSILKKLNIKRTESLDVYIELWDKFKYILISVFVIIMYCFFTSITYVTKDKIIYHSPLHPLGIVYKYSDVKKIEAGFGRKNFSLVDYNRKGQFYYCIYIGNNKVTFHTTSTNDKIKRYEESAYLELEEFDNELRKYDIEKITDDKYSKACDLDKEFCDRFIRIISK